MSEWESECVCVCVWVSEWEREREKQSSFNYCYLLTRFLPWGKLTQINIFSVACGATVLDETKKLRVEAVSCEPTILFEVIPFSFQMPRSRNATTQVLVRSTLFWIFIQKNAARLLKQFRFGTRGCGSFCQLNRVSWVRIWVWLG